MEPVFQHFQVRTAAMLVRHFNYVFVIFNDTVSKAHHISSSDWMAVNWKGVHDLILGNTPTSDWGVGVEKNHETPQT
jgi:hypothetical protein